MLYKREILEVEMAANNNERDQYIKGRIFNLPKSGRVYIADFYNGELAFRVCTDGRNIITYNYDSETWTRGINEYTAHDYYYVSVDTRSNKEAREFFKDKGDVVQLIVRLNDRINQKKRDKAYERARNKQERLTGMFPEFDEETKAWIDGLFPNLLFVSNVIKKGRRRVRTVNCEHCGAVFEVGSGEVRHKSFGVCPECGRKSMYLLERFKDCYAEKKKIHMVHYVDGFILFRWTRVFKDSGGYYFSDYYYSGICPENEKCNFAYGENIYGCIIKKQWRTPDGRNDAYLYPKGVNKLLDDVKNPFDLESVISDEMQYNLPVLIECIRNFRQCEYLLKLGLVNLAHDYGFMTRCRALAKGFAEITGLNKQLLPLCAKHNVNSMQLNAIKYAAGLGGVNEELFKLIIELKVDATDLGTITDMFGNRYSLIKLLRYVKKQKYGFERFKEYYRDYKYMAQQLNFELVRKYDIFPKDLIAEHDRLAVKVNDIKSEQQDKAFKTAVSKLYKTIVTDFSDEKFCIVLPKSNGDFTAEGQALKICVGSDMYIKKHMLGESLICFIRRIEEPEKSFVCCEISLSKYNVIQVHGYCNDRDNPLPADVKAFAVRYAAEIKKFRTAVAVSA